MVKVNIGGTDYEIDEWGNILKRRGKGFRKCFPDKDGYLKLTVKNSKNTPTYNEALHRIVYRAFHGEIPSGMTVDHIDNDRSNNHKDNLQVMTYENNAVKGNAENWVVTKPSGEELEVYNLEGFCRENGLHPRHIISHSYKGWRARKA